ncbi:hypothetical protein SLE2022_055370 [Rubroshorea leprosula]
MSFILGEERSYSSSDSICKDDISFQNDEETYSPESNGLCNGTRLLITKMGNHVIETKILSGNNIGQIVLISRMIMTPSNHSLPIKFQRRQFPLVRCFAMTINKSQGQTLSHVGIYLPRPIFSHGQLYVALSRVRSKQGLKILSLDNEGQISNKTTNIVFKEVFHRLA